MERFVVSEVTVVLEDEKARASAGVELAEVRCGRTVGDRTSFRALTWPCSSLRIHGCGLAKFQRVVFPASHVCERFVLSSLSWCLTLEWTVVEAA